MDEIEIIDFDESKLNSQSRRWMLTINNPVQSDEEIKDYVENLEHFKYCMFQREKGNETGTIHIQMFIIFSIGKRFSTIKNYFPTAHIEQAKGNNAQCRDYCSKTDTRISDNYYELGKFAEERARTDITNFMQLVEAGASDYELKKLYPKLFLDYFHKLPIIRMTTDIDYSKQDRDIEVIYVYGKAGKGKSTYVKKETINDRVFRVDTFDLSAFSNYQGENVLVIDEFKGQFKIQTLNKLLDSFPVKLRGLNSLVFARYTKVYIISNFHYKDLYKDEQVENIDQYKGFVRRLHRVIKLVDYKLPPIIERDTIFEDIPNEELIPFGRKKRINKNKLLVKKTKKD